MWSSWRSTTRRWVSRSTSLQHQHQDVLRLPRFVRRGTEHLGVPDLRPAGSDAGGERRGRRVSDPDRAGPQLPDRRVVSVRPEELLLPGHAEELPDLQYDEPIAFEGFMDVEVDGGGLFRVEIERAHMEEDTGKSLHVGSATGRIHGADYSLVDYNRAGSPAHRDRHQTDRRCGRQSAGARPGLRAAAAGADRRVDDSETGSTRATCVRT